MAYAAVLPAANLGLVSSSPFVQHVNLISGRNRREFQLADRGCNSPFGQVVTRVVVQADDQNPGMMALGSHNQVMEVFEVLGVASQNWENLGNRVDQHSRIRDRQKSDVSTRDRIVPLSPES
jgi:hypothetical protein